MSASASTVATSSPTRRDDSLLANRAGGGSAGRSRTAAPVFRAGGFWRRVAAAGIDIAVVAPVAALVTWLGGSIAGIGLPPSRHRGLDFWLDLLLTNHPTMWAGVGLVTAIALVYLALFHITLGRTLGMRVMHLRVIDLYGDAPSPARALARSFGYLACTLTVGLGFLWVGFDAERRGLHDWLSGTCVVVD